MSGKAAKIISLATAIMVLGTLFTGCGSKQDSGKQSPGAQTAQGTSKDSQSGPIYPLKTDVTLKYWVPLNSNVSPNFKNLGDTPFAKELAKRTGIKVEYIHPPQGQENEAFNLMMASGDLPDIVEWFINEKFNGGAENAINQGYILKLNDAIDKYAPNLKQILKENPEFEKYMKTDAGSMYAFPMIRDPKSPELLLSTMGPMIRKDWLDDLGLPVPTTLDEWETALKAFKDKKGAVAPLTFTGTGTNIHLFILDAGHFISDYVVNALFYHEGDVVKLGMLEPKYKDAIELLSRWYKEGLLDKNVFSTDDKIRESNILSGKSGASLGWANSHLRTWMTMAKEKDPKYELVATVNPTIKKGDKVKFGRTTPIVEPTQGSISAKSKNAEPAARFLDYGYTKEGQLLMNYGVEGESYKMVNGSPEFTELVTNNPNKTPINQVRAMYTRTVYNGPTIQMGLPQITVPEVADAMKKWYNTDAQKYSLFGLTALPEEASQMAKLQSSVYTYHDEMVTKFILGVEPISNFGKFQDQLKKLGAEKMLELVQAQYDRFKKR